MDGLVAANVSSLAIQGTSIVPPSSNQTITLPNETGTLLTNLDTTNFTTLNTPQTISALKTFSSAITPTAGFSNGTYGVQFPSLTSADTLVTQATAQTLTNKTMSGMGISGRTHNGYTPITLSSTWDAFGDSITAGTGIPTASHNWTYLVSTALANTCNNNAVSGSMTHDVVYKIYNTRSISLDRSAIIFVGTNDIREQYDADTTTGPDRVLEQCLACVTTSLLYCSIPAANKFNARGGTGVVTTGTWTNTSIYPLGIYTSSASATVAATVTGRYICFSITSTHTGSSTYTGEQFNVSVTNFLTDVGTTATYTQSNIEPSCRMIAGVLANQYYMRTYIMDTQITGSHTITLTYTGTPGLDNFYVDWFAGWSSSTVFNNVLAIGPSNWNYRVDNLNTAAAAYQTDTRRTAYNQGLSQICHVLRENYLVPAYYVDLGYSTHGTINSDGLHPTFSGHNRIASCVLDVLQNGEKNWLGI